MVAAANDVLVNVAHDSTYVLGFGHRSDLEVVERLWTSLAVQMAAAAQRRMDAGEHRDARVSGLSWRLSFYDGFIDAVGSRLQRARAAAIAQTIPTQQTGEPSAALVLREKGERVKSFYDTASDARGSWRGTWSGRTQASGSAIASGRADGARADLGQPGLRRRGRARRLGARRDAAREAPPTAQARPAPAGPPPPPGCIGIAAVPDATCTAAGLGEQDGLPGSRAPSPTRRSHSRRRRQPATARR